MANEKDRTIADGQADVSQGKDQELSPKQLDEISGGRNSNDPCEGGQKH